MPLDAVGPVGGDAGPDLVEAGGAGGDVRLVDQALGDRDVQQAVGQREVGAGQRLQVQRRVAGGGRAPGVDDDVLGAAPAALVEVLHGRRHGVGRVAADQDDDVGGGDVAQRERHAAVEAERPVGRAGGRGHAEPAVVVDGAGAQRDPGELAELVGLLVGQRAAAEAADGVAAVRRLGAPDRRDDQVEGVVPGGLDQRAGPVARHRADQRPEQPLGVVEQLRRRPALRAQAAAVGREVQRHEGRRALPRGDRHAALQRAVGAVGVRRPRRPETPRGGGGHGGGGHVTRVRGRCFPSGAPASTLRSVDLTAAAGPVLGPVVECRGDPGPDHPPDRRSRRGGPEVRPAEQRDVPRIAATLTVALADSRWTRWALPDDGRMQRLTRLHELDAGHRGVATAVCLGHRRRHGGRRVGAAGRRRRHRSPAGRRHRRPGPRAAVPARPTARRPSPRPTR